MHPVAWNRYLSVAKAKFPPLPHPPTNSAKRKKMSSVLGTLNERLRDRLPSSAPHSLEALSVQIPHPLASPSSLSPSLLWDSQRLILAERDILQPATQSLRRTRLSESLYLQFPRRLFFKKSQINQGRTQKTEILCHHQDSWTIFIYQFRPRCCTFVVQGCVVSLFPGWCTSAGSPERTSNLTSTQAALSRFNKCFDRCWDGQWELAVSQNLQILLHPSLEGWDYLVLPLGGVSPSCHSQVTARWVFTILKTKQNKK